MLRISLIVAILAGLGAIYLGYDRVGGKIKTITTERDEAATARDASKAAESKAKGEAKKAKDSFESANQDLIQRTETLTAKTAEAAEQRKRADKNLTDFTKAAGDLKEARQQLNVYTSVGLSLEQILKLRDSLNAVSGERDAFVSENKILLKQITYLETELGRYEPKWAKDPKLPPGLKGKVVAYDPKFDFVVLDIGGNNGVMENGQMLVNREGKLVAKVRISKVEPNRCIANIIPDWKYGEIMEGDQVIVQ